MTITIRGTRPRQIAAHLKQIGDRSKNVSRVWPSVGAYLSREVRKQFVTEGAHFGRPWRKLRPEYLAWKRQHGFSGKILRQTGGLMKDFTGRPMDIERYSNDDAWFGSNNPKSAWHHYGTRRGGKRINPPRKILVITKDVREDINDMFKNYVRHGRIHL